MNKADDKKNCDKLPRMQRVMVLADSALKNSTDSTDRICPPVIALILIALYFVTGGEHINMCQWAWPADNW